MNNKKDVYEKDNKNYDSYPAKRIRELLQENKVTQIELSKATGTSRQAISQYADGTIIPNCDKLKAIANYFDVSTDYLLGLVNSKARNISYYEISKALGISDKAIDNIKRYGYTLPGYNIYSPIFEDDEFMFFIKELYSKKCLPAYDKDATMVSLLIVQLLKVLEVDIIGRNIYGNNQEKR